MKDNIITGKKEQGNNKMITILKNRAAEIARSVKEKEEVQGESLMIVTFRLADEVYAFELKYVSEVFRISNLTIVPGTPEFVIGIMNVRGKIFSLIDMKKFFDLPGSGFNDQDKAIILRDNSMEFAVHTDEIIDIYAVRIDSLEQVPHTFTGIRTEYIKGITSSAVIILDG